MFRDRSGDIMVRLRDVVRQQIVAADATSLVAAAILATSAARLLMSASASVPALTAPSSSRTEVKPGDGISSEPPALTARPRSWSAPIGDDHAVEAPFVAQNLLQQMLVFVGVAPLTSL